MENIVKNKVKEVLLKDRDIEDVEVYVNPDENTDPSILKVDMSVKFKKPIETFTVKFDKPEGMSDEQFKILIKHIQEQIEENNIHDGELTS